MMADLAPERSARLRPFRAEIGDDALADLDRRIADTRWPVPPPGTEWQWGTSSRFMRDLVDYWHERFTWREWEDRLNAHEQYLVELRGADVHVLIEQGSGADPMSIILSHGWPGLVFELIDLVEPLAHPERFGGDAEDGFTVVLPSLPGFAFSAAPTAIECGYLRRHLRVAASTRSIDYAMHE